MVFQQYMPLQRTDALRNVEMPLLYGDGRDQRRARRSSSRAWPSALHRLPNELGRPAAAQKAIARALVTSPRIIMADG
ncbi:MAG: hypothetical protein U0Z44_20490 [Kouleothrix sp.]